MLVNISYSIDLDEVPDVVRRFVEADVRNKLQTDLTYAVEDILAQLKKGEENIGRCIEKVQQLRELVVKLDMRLSDCNDILRGYQMEILNPQEAAHHPGQMDIQSVQEDLAKLKDKLTGVDDATNNR
jgi:chromosome segregation ATPase